MNQKNNANYEVRSSVYVWLVVGLIMIYFQIIIGGITRLTGSGLSITEWEIVTGTLPPLNETEWILEFEKYKATPQYEKINRGMDMGSIFQPGTFKFIYFWEYLHRLWARAMGIVFIIPFAIFYYKKWIPSRLLRNLGIVIFLSMLAATFGWIMVASGLVNRPWVNAYKLAIHLSIGISVFISLLWALVNYKSISRVHYNFKRPKYLLLMLLLLCVQIFLGGVMSGTKASLFINSWPDYNGSAIPSDISAFSNWTVYNFNYYEESGFLVSLVQFLHRNLAYVIFIYAFVILFRKGWIYIRSIEGRSYLSFVILLIAQVVIGILTLINSIGIVPVFYGVLHQAFAVLTLSAFVIHYYYLSYIEVPVRISSDDRDKRN